MNRRNGNRLLTDSDSSPIAWINRGASSSVALVCEHAGNAVPATLDNLGLSADQLQEHTAIDIGAEATARRLAELLNAPLLIQRYSRLVIDCNRPPDAPDSIPESSHGTEVPANKGLNEQQRNARIKEIFLPYDTTLRTFLETPDTRFAFSIHSFTPRLNGEERPWDIGLLYRHDSDTSNNLCRNINSSHPDFVVGLNQPYTIDDESDWFVPQHAERLKLSHSLIEVRNDLIRTAEGQERMAIILATAIIQIASGTHG
ncbi:MAG: N-formylglutamate amidohydrolase [Granulosicoccus sp.]